MPSDTKVNEKATTYYKACPALFFYHLIYHLMTLSSGVILYTLLVSLSELSDNMIIHSYSYLGARIWLMYIKDT